MTSYSVLLLLVCLTTSLASIVHWSGKDGLHLRSDQIRHIPLQEVLGKVRELRAASNNPPVSSKVSLNDHSHYGLIHYSGNDSKVIFVLTYNLNSGTVTSSTLYRSADYGTTFTNINSQLDSSTTHLTLYPQINISPEDYRTIIIPHESKPYLYISKNEGASFTKRILTPSTINPRSLHFHPTVEKWFLAHDPTNKSLYVSTDLGSSFTKLSDNVASLYDYQWGVYPYDIDRTIVYYNTNPPNSNTTQVQLYIQRSPYTTNTVTEFDPSLGKHDAFLIVDRYIFAQKTVNNIVQLYTSYDRKPFKLAHIPSSLLHKNYLVASIKALQALVIVEHTNGQFNLYLSEEAAQYFSLSLSDIVVSSNYVIDLELIESMNYTTYIANQNVRSSPTVTNPPVRTLISFDAGGNWEKLRPPSQDSDGNDIQCVQPSCSLHFHMDNSQYFRTGVYSQDSAPGIIIAHGSTGASLSTSNVNLYISRDGGSTWYMTLKSTWGVAVMDHGGLIVATQDYHQFSSSPATSKVLKYSCDEGNSWTNFTFSNQYTVVFGVITEPGETTTVVSLYGIDSTNTGWVVIRVNFTNIFPSKCGNSDFYKWTPYDETTDTGCLLGGSVTIERRLNTHCCLIGKNYVRVINYTKCACSEDDFECDYGYKHVNGIDGPCIRDDTITLPNSCTSGVASYIKSQGYRKIGGDICSGGLESQYAPVKAPCCLASGGGTGPTMSTTSRTSGPTMSTISRTTGPTMSITSRTSGPTMSTTSRTTGPTMSITSRTSGPTMSTTSRTTGPTMSITSRTSGPTMSTTSRTSGPTMSTTSRTFSTAVPTNSATKSNTNVVIGLGVVLLIAILLIVIMFVIMILLIKKSFGNKNRTRNYHAVPSEELFAFRNEHEGRLVGIPYKDDDDDDEEPLPL